MSLRRITIILVALALLPATAADTITSVLEVADNNLILLGGTRSWAFAGGQFIDLTAAFGGGAYAINEQDMVGGGNAAGSYLRFSDGRVVQPWPGTEPVRLIGPGGHFTGLGFYGDPAGNVTTTPFTYQPFTTYPQLYGINRAGDVVGNHRRFFEFSPFLYRAGQVIYISDRLMTGCECNLMSARAINDAGYIAGVAQFSGGAQRAVLLVPIAPATPEAIIFALNSRRATVTWEPSAGAVDYILEAGRLAGTSDLFAGSVGAVLEVSVTVPPGRYYVRVRARNASGTSAPTPDIVIDVP